MTIEQLMAIGTKEGFYKVMDALALSDRQQQVFIYKYLNQWPNSEIAKRIGFCGSVVSKELVVIRNKLVQYEPED